MWPYQVDDENDDDDDDNTENAPSGKKKLNSGQTFVHLVHRRHPHEDEGRTPT